MKNRIVWPLVAVVGMAALSLALSQSFAQRPPVERPINPGGMPFAGPPGRFVVAHGSATQVLVLDTMTGKVYRVKEDDFKKSSELPKAGPIGRPGGPDRPPVRDAGRKDGDNPRRRPDDKREDRKEDPRRNPDPNKRDEAPRRTGDERPR